MDKLEKDVTDYMITGNNMPSSAIEISQRIIDTVNIDDVQANLLKLIQTMGPYLTHKDETIRSKAVGLLTFNINECHEEKLTESAVTVLVKFYCSRLSDHACVPNLMPGLVALTGKYKNFTSPCTELVVRSLNNEIHVQSFPHLTRNAAFQVFENLLKHHLDDLKLLKDEFIPGFIRSMTSEKDPRNLMTVYSLVQSIVKSLDITNHVEDMFDVTFCYFPITFRPPPDNPYGITAKDLKVNLRKCMASTPLFSRFALPLLLQKLATTSGTAKKDALETLAACVAVYPTDEVLAVGTKLYDAVKVEILNEDPDPGLREPSLDAINALTKAITSHVTDSSEDVEITRVIRPLIDECATLLQELHEDSIKPASLILRSVASASPFVHSLVENNILPKLLRQHRDIDHEKNKHTYLILCTMVAIIQARKIVFGPMVDHEKSIVVNHDSVLVSFKDRFIDIFSSSIRESKDCPEVRLMGVLGLGLLCVLNDFMTKNERSKCVEVLSTVLETEEEEGLRNSVEMSLLEISNFDSKLISDVTVPILMNALPDFSSEDTADNFVPYKFTLGSIQKLCTSPTIYVHTEEHLLRKFIYICSHNEDKKYALEVIRTLLKLIQAQNEQKHLDLKNCVESLLHPLLVSIVSATLGEAPDIIILNRDITQTINLIILAIFSNLDASEQFNFASKIINYFEDRDLSDLNLAATPNFRPLSIDVPEKQAACSQIYATVLSAFRKGAKMPVESSFLDSIIDKALESESQDQVVSLSRIVASMINKQDSGDDTYLDDLVCRLDRLIQTQSLSGLTVYIWVTKALIIRGHKKGLEMTDSIIQWIPNPVIGKHASTGFDVLLSDDPLCLNKLCFAKISLLYKQKFMTYSLPKLLSKYSTAPPEGEKLNYLIAVAYLLKNVPKSILLDQLPPLVVLLIESVSIPETELQLSTLDMFQFVLQEATDILKSHIGALLPALTSLIRPKQASMKVRISALKCLELVAIKVSRDTAVPFASDTIKSIAVPLDDKKRLVRKQAVECREKWFLLCQKK